MPEPEVPVLSEETAPAPSEPETVPEVQPEAPVTPEPTLYDLPDGRKVPAEVVKSEYENLLKDYTQKSQKLAEIERAKQVTKPDVPVWKQPDYVPNSYDELIERGAELALQRLQESRQAEEARSREIASRVDAEIAELRKADPKLDENALFAHATKWGFQDLKMAHSNMNALKQASLEAEQRTLKNIKARGDTPVAGTPGIVVNDGAADPFIGQRYGSALEYFRSLNKN